MRVLTFTSLYPSDSRPTHGVFVENRLRSLIASGAVSVRVVAPVPWFPFTNTAFGEYGRLAATKSSEIRHGICIVHPRYAAPPKVGMTVAPLLMYLGAVRQVAALRAEGFEFDLIDAHYFYPDGVAAVLLGRRFNRPVCITGRGTDLNLIPRYRLPRRLIKWAAREAAGLVTVCQALKDALVELGVPAERVRVFRNGVDLDLFRPHEHMVARRALGLSKPTLLTVGGLIERKGIDLIIRALALLPDHCLLIAGDGPLRLRLEDLARSQGFAQRIRFLGTINHEMLPAIYSAADAFILASSREGCPNVLLESMACGTPVIAADVWGVAEVVAAPEAGVLFSKRTPEAIAEATRIFSVSAVSREATRRYAEKFDWGATTAGQLELFESMLNGAGGPTRRRK